MWLFTKEFFVSAVEDSSIKGVILARFRSQVHVEAFCKKYHLLKTRIITTLQSDYHFRIRMSKKDWVKVCANEAGGINYPNFKDAVLGGKRWTDEEGNALIKVWGVMRSYQDGMGLSYFRESENIQILQGVSR